MDNYWKWVSKGGWDNVIFSFLFCSLATLSFLEQRLSMRIRVILRIMVECRCAAVHGVAKSWMWHSCWTITTNHRQRRGKPGWSLVKFLSTAFGRSLVPLGSSLFTAFLADDLKSFFLDQKEHELLASTQCSLHGGMRWSSIETFHPFSLFSPTWFP